MTEPKSPHQGLGVRSFLWLGFLAGCTPAALRKITNVKGIAMNKNAHERLVLNRRGFFAAGGAALAGIAGLGLAGCTGSAEDTGSGSSVAAAEIEGSTAVEKIACPLEPYSYDSINEWTDPIPMGDGKMTLHDVMDGMAKPGYDMEAFAESELGEFTVKSSYLNNHIGKLDSDEVTQYWSERGMTHEAHDLDDEDRQWASLVPASYDAAKSYPLLFVWHGTGNPVLLAEGYGFGEAAKEKDWICVFPWAKNDDTYLSEFDRILAFMKEHYSIDDQRIYTTGFSKGGATSQLLALQRAGVLAAGSSCGMPAGSSPTERLRTDDFMHVQAGIPMLFFGGDEDGVVDPMPYDLDYTIKGANGFIAINGNADKVQTEVACKELVESGDEVEKAIGLSCDETSIVEADGTKYHRGSFVNADGKESVVFIQCDGAIHWPTPSMATYVLDFLGQWTHADAQPFDISNMANFLTEFSL